MTSIVLQYPRGETKTLVKAAFENTKGVKQYHDDGQRIVGKTGMGIGSYGESVTVEIPETQSSQDETMISITASKEVSTNITANPEKYKSRFIEQLERLRGREVEDILNIMSENMDPNQSKEIESADRLSDGSSNVAVIMVLMFLAFLFFQFIIFASI